MEVVSKFGGWMKMDMNGNHPCVIAQGMLVSNIIINEGKPGYVHSLQSHSQ